MAVQPRSRTEAPADPAAVGSAHRRQAELAAPALEDLLPRDGVWWVQKFNQFMAAVLDKAARRPEPVALPSVTTLRPLFWACQGGRNGEHDNSRQWFDLWSTDGDTVQHYVRGLFQVARTYRYPPERYDVLVDALAARVIPCHVAAAEQQQARLAKLAERKGPAARAAAAHAVLEHLEPLQTALLAFDAATRDGSGTRWNSLALDLQRLEHAAKRELS